MEDITSAGGTEGCRCRVLVIDDNEEVLELVRLFLEVEGHSSVITATSAVNALQNLDELMPDVILLDWQLEEGTAADFVQAYTRQNLPKAAPVIVMSGFADRIEGIGEGDFAGILPKPFTIDQLRYSLAPYCGCRTGISRR